jgi:ribonuclease PH
VLAAAYGPRGLPPRREHAERATLEVVFAPASGVRAGSERSMSCCVRAALESVLLAGLHPRTGVSIVLQARAARARARRAPPPATLTASAAAAPQVVRDDGAALAACVNAACAAAVDAGVPLSGMLGARSCDELAR